MKTYNVIFNDAENSNDKGFALTKQDCVDYVLRGMKTKESFFGSYLNGTVSIVCNETGEVFSTQIIL